VDASGYSQILLYHNPSFLFASVPNVSNSTSDISTVNTGYVKLPTPPIKHPTETQPDTRTGDTLARQFQKQMQAWQRPLFGSIRKAGNTKNLLRQLLAK